MKTFISEAQQSDDLTAQSCAAFPNQRSSFSGQETMTNVAIGECKRRVQASWVCLGQFPLIFDPVTPLCWLWVYPITNVSDNQPSCSKWESWFCRLVMGLRPPHLQGNRADVSVNEAALVCSTLLGGLTNYSPFTVVTVFWLGFHWSCSSVTADSRAEIHSCKSNWPLRGCCQFNNWRKGTKVIYSTSYEEQYYGFEQDKTVQTKADVFEDPGIRIQSSIKRCSTHICHLIFPFEVQLWTHGLRRRRPSRMLSDCAVTIMLLKPTFSTISHSSTDGRSRFSASDFHIVLTKSQSWSGLLCSMRLLSRYSFIDTDVVHCLSWLCSLAA